MAVADIPLLYEIGRDREFDAVVVAACEPEQQLERMMARDGLDADARQRIAAQMPIEEKVRRATYVIRTDGSHVPAVRLAITRSSAILGSDDVAPLSERNEHIEHSGMGSTVRTAHGERRRRSTGRQI